MAARRSWVVFVDNGDFLHQDRDYNGKYNIFSQENNDLFSLFFKEVQAIEYAKYIATKYPGRDVHVFKQSFGYTCQPKPVEFKQWTDDGKFIPADSI